METTLQDIHEASGASSAKLKFSEKGKIQEQQKYLRQEFLRLRELGTNFNNASFTKLDPASCLIGKDGFANLVFSGGKSSTSIMIVSFDKQSKIREVLILNKDGTVQADPAAWGMNPTLRSNKDYEKIKGLLQNIDDQSLERGIKKSQLENLDRNDYLQVLRSVNAGQNHRHLEFLDPEGLKATDDITMTKVKGGIEISLDSAKETWHRHRQTFFSHAYILFPKHTNTRSGSYKFLMKPDGSVQQLYGQEKSGTVRLDAAESWDSAKYIVDAFLGKKVGLDEKNKGELVLMKGQFSVVPPPNGGRMLLETPWWSSNKIGD